MSGGGGGGGGGGGRFSEKKFKDQFFTEKYIQPEEKLNYNVRFVLYANKMKGSSRG